MKALIIGGGEMVWDDVDETVGMFGDGWWDLAVAVNDIGSHWPHPLDAWVSRHPKKFAAWMAHRTRLGHPDGFTTYTKKGSGSKHADVAISHTYSGGASGLLAVEVALKHLGATRIVLCGVPMSPVPHFAESEVHPQGKPWHPDAHRRRWREHAGDLVGVVKSMSMVYDSGSKTWVPSWTRQLLGAPTPAWLEDDQDE